MLTLQCQTSSCADSTSPHMRNTTIATSSPPQPPTWLFLMGATWASGWALRRKRVAASSLLSASKVSVTCL
jgi:hypothetical protein